jgi:hypothetical protein
MANHTFKTKFEIGRKLGMLLVTKELLERVYKGKIRAGIDGIKYPNNSVSGGKTTGFNYVVFDENSVHIDKKEDRELK